MTGAAASGSLLGITGETALGSSLGITGTAALGSLLGITVETALGSSLGITGAAALGSLLVELIAIIFLLCLFGGGGVIDRVRVDQEGGIAVMILLHHNANGESRGNSPGSVTYIAW